MAELNLSSPLLENMEVLECVDEKEGISTYVLKNKTTEQMYMLKYISIPESETQIEGLRYSGAIQSDEEAQAYFAQVAEDYRRELETLQRLADCTNIDAYRAFRLEPKENAIGYNAYLLSDYRETLEKYLQKTPMTHRKAMELALDLCGTLADLRKAGLMHCNIKPTNICLNNQGHFMLSDLGLLRLNQLQFATIPSRVIGNYSAPELHDAFATPNETVDLYSIGLILYRIYNGGHTPFEDERTNEKLAADLRLSGKALPAPIFADYEMANIILKVCAFRPEDRYQTPDELKEALTDYMQRNEVSDTEIAPPLVVEDAPLPEEALNEAFEPMQLTASEELTDEFVQHFSPDTESAAAAAAVAREAIDAEETAEDPVGEEVPEEETAVPVTEEVPEEEAPAKEESPVAEEALADTEAPAPKKEKKKFPVIGWIAIALLLLAGIAAALYFTLYPNVTALAVEDCTTDSFRVVAVATNPERITATCSDTYGNNLSATYDGKGFFFKGLTPGTQYKVKLESFLGAVRGTGGISVTTETSTEILYFVAKPLSETQVELNFSSNGPEPPQWAVECVPLDVESPAWEVPFSGHSAQISELSQNVVYRFILKAGEATLTGVTELEYDNTVKTTVGSVTSVFDKDAGTLNLRWGFDGETPASWTVTCSGADGYQKLKTVTEPQVVFEDLAANSNYTIELFCSGMPKSLEKNVSTAEAAMTDLAALRNEDGSYTVSWSCTSPVKGWSVTYAPADTPALTQTVEAAECSLRLAGLLPETAYQVTVHAVDAQVQGENAVGFTTEKAEKFKDYGVSSVYTGLFLKPQKDTWSVRDLGANRESFRPGEGVAFAVQPPVKPQSSEDTVEITLVVRSRDGKIIALDHSQRSWDSLWEKNGANTLFVGGLEKTPQEPGAYTLEIYFNGKTVDKKSFTVK